MSDVNASHDGDLHKCTECGFMKLRRKGSMQYDLADQQYRDDGTLPRSDTPIGGDFMIHEPMPACHKGVNIGKDFNNEASDKYAEGHRVVSKPRPCKVFEQFQPNKTAEQHEEMLQAKEIQRLNDEAARKAEIIAEKRHEESMAIARESNRISRDAKETADKALIAADQKNRIAVLAIVVGVLIAIFSAGVSIVMNQEKEQGNSEAIGRE